MSEDRTEDTDLSGVQFTVFGLGNKTYQHYNSMGRHLDKRMEELNAKRIYERGEGDDDGNLEEDFVKWNDKLWPALCQHFGIQLEAGKADEMCVCDPLATTGCSSPFQHALSLLQSTCFQGHVPRREQARASSTYRPFPLQGQAAWQK